jgi:S1-C subfamily serine protease
MFLRIFMPIACGFLLSMHFMLGLRMRRYSKPRTVVRLALRTSLMGAFFAVPLLFLPGSSWGWAIPLIGGPWLMALVATFPSRNKRLGKPPSLQFRFAQEALAVVELGHAVGNGFFIAPDLLITSCHILAADLGGRLRAHTIKGQVELSIFAVDPIGDLVIFKTKTKGPGVLTLATGTEELAEGDLLIHTCYSKPHLRQPRWHEAQGRFHGKDDVLACLVAQKGEGIASIMAIAQDILVADLTAEPGQSGSPVFNERHEVIGVVTAGSKDEHRSLLMPVESIHRLLPTK